MKFLALVSFLLWSSQVVCPPGKVWSGKSCEWWNICKDGTPLLPGKSCPRDAAPVARPPEVCTNKTVFLKEGQAAKVLVLNSGEAARLYEQYVKEAKASRRVVDYENLKLVFWEKGKGQVRLEGGVDVKLTVGSMIRGYNYEKLWVRALAKRKAERVKNAGEVAKSLKADLTCGQ